jgi:hypothetical protein
MILQPNPWHPIALPDPEVLGKYGEPAASALRALRRRAKAKGKEDRKWLKQNGLNIFR